jgi:hypothetical protein
MDHPVRQMKTTLMLSHVDSMMTRNRYRNVTSDLQRSVADMLHANELPIAQFCSAHRRADSTEP